MECRLRKRSSADADPTKLRWLWAVGEQIRLHTLHDARWVDHARNDWPSQTSADEFVKFLHAYRVVRNIPRAHRPEILRQWRRRFSGAALAGDVNQLTTAWINAVNDGKRICGRNCYSAASKFMWFFRPQQMTMFDTYARLALSKYVRRPVNPDSFLEAFEQYFKSNRSDIQEALAAFTVRYPYERRIADKHLWLCGSKLTIAQIRADVRSWC
jgi:hypothetical protein